MILKNSLLGFVRRLPFYIKIIVTIYTETYRVYPDDFMIDDSENKDFTRINPVNRRTNLLRDLHVMNKRVTRESQTFSQNIFLLGCKRLCKVRLQKAFLFDFLH